MMRQHIYQTQEEEEQAHPVCPLLAKWCDDANFDDLLNTPFKAILPSQGRKKNPVDYHDNPAINEDIYNTEEHQSEKLNPLRLASYPSDYFQPIAFDEHESETKTLEHVVRTPPKDQSMLPFNPRRLSSLFVTAFVAVLAYTVGYRHSYQAHAVTITPIPRLSNDDLGNYPLSNNQARYVTQFPGIAVHIPKKYRKSSNPRQ